ncbi:MAG: 16S rRNA (cytosine(1402)-N(4))-methyltransferase RsmH [Desulfovibrio sp.]|jgi:16S rRNA (cytosine1402-N4)-methyltransferase|nr:16S rRNA (cytosine(1402)-N(4))-methyltransferase RsmH [Desulfovibrio sp.]
MDAAEHMPEASGFAPTRIAGLHTPVLLAEVLEFFEPRPGLRCLDATLGLGGHTEHLLRKAEAAGIRDTEVLGMDRDASALELAVLRLAPFGPRVRVRNRPFSECDLAMQELGWEGADFVLADLGTSSPQLDRAARGFSFSADGPLDMRMDQRQEKNAADLVNAAPAQKLRDIIRTLGEEPLAGRIASAIVRQRDAKRIESTRELARIVETAYPAQRRAAARNHPATRTFQALRMAVNDEMGELESFLRKIAGLLRPGGRVLAIAFHSLEDRAVKRLFREEATDCLCPAHVAVCRCGHKARLKVLTAKPIRPQARETAANPRARSAKLRAAERLVHG